MYENHSEVISLNTTNQQFDDTIFDHRFSQFYIDRDLPCLEYTRHKQMQPGGKTLNVFIVNPFV